MLDEKEWLKAWDEKVNNIYNTWKQEDIDLACKIEVALQKKSGAFYMQDQALFDEACEEFYQLTKGMSKRKIAKFCDAAPVVYMNSRH